MDDRSGQVTPHSSSPRCPATTTSRWNGRWKSSSCGGRGRPCPQAADLYRRHHDAGYERRGIFHRDPNSLWQGNSLYELYQEAHTPWEWHKPIFDRWRELGMICFSTPFDATAVDFLEELDAPCYKIASFENTDIPLIRKVAATGKPMIISTGMATVAELDETVCGRPGGRLQGPRFCSNAPAPTLPPRRTPISGPFPICASCFGCEVGLSDHTMGLGAAVAAVALGCDGD